MSSRLAAAIAVTLALAGVSAAAMPGMTEPAFAGKTGSSNTRSSTASASRHQAPRHPAPRKHKLAHRKRPHTKGPLPLKMIWGPLTLPDGASAFPTYHHLGVQVLETELIWTQTAATRPNEPTNPADPAYRWPPALERMIDQAAQYGIAVAVMVRGAPAWANGGQNETWAPENAADYANFLQAASRRYPTVHYWMIWGEANGTNFNPMPANSPVGPRRYAVLLDAAYGALKAVSNSNLVIGGMTWTGGLVKPADFIRWMRLPNGAPPRLDYYGHNPYGTRFPNLKEGPVPNYGEYLRTKKHTFSAERDLNTLNTMHAELAAVYRHRPGGAPKLWLSEWSISSDGPSYAFSYFVSRPVQAKWLTAAFKLVDSVSYVAGLGWYELLDQPASVESHLTEGLMTSEGVPKPAFNAYVRAK